METFNFPVHGNPSFTPVENNSSIELKGGFRFDPEPSEPILKSFDLNFKMLNYELLPDGNTDVDGTVNPTLNVMALYQFYVRHGTWKSFIYPSPVFGNVIVKFDRPFTVPEVAGNRGRVQNLQVTLREHLV